MNQIHTTNYHPSPPRESALDFLRGVSVLAMMIAHALFFFYTGGNIILTTLARTGNIISFTIFLCISGASTYYSYLVEPQAPPGQTGKVLKRMFYILLGYYLVAFVARADTLTTLAYPELGRKIVSILLFQDVPNFTEFLIPFMIFSMLVLLFRPIVRHIASSFWLTLFVSAGIYAIGYALYPVELAAPWQAIKALIAGDQALLYFPILQYAPVYLFGLMIGHFMQRHPAKETREKAAFLGSLALVVVILGGTFLSTQYSLPLLDPLKRWPPSVSFMAIGVATALILFVLYSYLSSFSRINAFWQTINYIGRDAFDLFVVHILLLFLYKYTLHYQTPNALIALTLFFILLSASILLSALNWKNSRTAFRKSAVTLSGKSKYRPKKRHFAAAAACLVLIFTNLNYRSDASTFGETVNLQELTGNMPPTQDYTQADVNTTAYVWQNIDYGWSKQITLVNNGILPLYEGNAVASVLNTSSLVTAHKLQTDLSDAIIYYYYDDRVVEVPFTLKDGQIELRIQERVYPSQWDNRYFLYYGSDLPFDHKEITTEGRIQAGYRVAMGSELAASFLGSINRVWHVKQTPTGVTPLPLVFSVTVTNPELLQNAVIEYRVGPTPKSGSLMSNSPIEKNVIIDAASLAPGEYYVYAVDKTSLKPLTRKLRFKVSEPVLVAWSLDFEGWDVPQNYLDAIADQTKRHHNFPLTHFFSPRIYLHSVVSPERAEYLTTWVSRRLSDYGEELALHLHMHKDLLEAVGVSSKDGPKWGHYTDGYDVQSTAYSYDEYKKVLEYSLKKFREANLPTPIGFRAGGWFVNEEILRALEDTGFLYDSSGREKKMWGGKLESPWDLAITTQPYFPSRQDQNKPGTPQFNLLEIPNNGGDSWAFSGAELKNRFLQNFNGTPVKAPVAVTFLSHPQWFLAADSRDGEKMEVVLNTTDQYLYEKDQGPVFYTTEKQIYTLWQP
jgi:hypothetical protein